MRWRWQDRLAFRVAFRMNRRQFADLRGGPITPPSLSLPDLFVTAVSVVMLLGVIVLAVLGVYVAFFTEIFFPWLIGGVLVLIAIALRPRFGKLDKQARELDRADAPELFRLIDQVSAAIGTKPPHVVLASHRMNASAGAYGVRRRRVLKLGMPLWAVLTPQQRVALLGHELGHFVNGDVAASPLNSMAFTTLAALSDMTVPTYNRGLIEWFAGLMMTVFHEGFAAAQICVTAMALRSRQRAEYYADSLSAWAGGTEAAVGLLDVALLHEGMYTMVRAAARRSDHATDWVAAGRTAQAELASRIPRLRQLDKRDSASLFVTHPPSGLRAQMLESRPYVAPAVVLTESVSAAIDAELAKPYRYMIQNT